MSNDTVVSLGAPARVSDPLTELLRTGARRLIEAAVSAEFEEYLSAFVQEKLPEVSVSQVARRYDVNTNLVFKWRRDPQLRSAAVQPYEPSFVPVEVVSSPMPESPTTQATIEIELCNGHRVSVTGSFDVEALCRLVHGLGSARRRHCSNRWPTRWGVTCSPVEPSSPMTPRSRCSRRERARRRRRAPGAMCVTSVPGPAMGPEEIVGLA